MKVLTAISICWILWKICRARQPENLKGCKLQLFLVNCTYLKSIDNYGKIEINLKEESDAKGN